MTVNTNIMIVIVVGLMLCAWVYNVAPESASVQIPALMLSIGLLIKQFITDTKVDKADAKVEKSIAVSEENALSIAVSSQQQSHALQAVDQKVDGHLSGLTKDIRMLTEKVLNLEKDKVVKQSETAQLLGAMAAVAPSSSTGTTTPLGTPIDGGTTIMVDPPEAATISSVPPKGKPKVGDPQ